MFLVFNFSNNKFNPNGPLSTIKEEDNEDFLQHCVDHMTRWKITARRAIDLLIRVHYNAKTGSMVQQKV